jgi:hypothetical protein
MLQEGSAPATQTPFLAYQSRFKMPFADCGATNGNLYYSFNARRRPWAGLSLSLQ